MKGRSAVKHGLSGRVRDHVLAKPCIHNRPSASFSQVKSDACAAVMQYLGPAKDDWTQLSLLIFREAVREPDIDRTDCGALQLLWRQHVAKLNL